MDPWTQERLMPPGGDSTRQEFVFQKFTTDVANDPFIPTGVIAPFALERQQDQNVLDAQLPARQQQQPFYSGDIHHNVGIYASHDDSGYGGSRVSQTVTSPSIDAGQEGNWSQLQCGICNEFKAKNKSELRKHKNRHTKPYKCIVPTCHKGFATANDLERHRRTVHRDECRNESNSIVYNCTHCLTEPGKQNRRKKQEWPRKDNFIAHLARIHNIDANVMDNLDRYIVRSQSQPETSPDIAQRSNRDAAQHDLTGVGTLPDLMAPQTEGTYVKQLANLTGGQVNALTEQRLRKFWQNNSNHFESSGEPQYITPHVLGQGLNDDLLGSSLETAQNRPLDFDFVSNHRVMDPPPQNVGMIASLQHPGIATNDGETNDADMDNDETDACISNHLERPNSPAGIVPEPLESAAPPSQAGHGTDHNAIMDIVKRLQLPTPVGQPSSLTDHVKKLSQETRHALVAVLCASDLDGDNQGIVDLDTAAKSQNACHMCQKRFRRPCELTKHLKRHSKPYACTWKGCSKTFGSKNDWKRHECKQHYHMETWTCDLSSCPKRSWNRRETFKAHLIKEHMFAGPEAIEKKVEQCRRGANSASNFWCGFCVKNIDAAATATWTTKFDHIDNHFCGKDGMEQKSIDEWIYPEPENRGDIAEALSSATQSTPITFCPPDINEFRKRKAEPTNLESQPLGKKQSPSDILMWDCCGCGAFLNIRTSPSCITCEHVRCDYCVVSRHVLRHEDDITGYQFNNIPAFGEQDLGMHAG
ncbi:C2H2 type zinc finger domain protein [Metarhizium acridum CQMa 102]|uniref:C2H2 type zinc finger domain protein n=1 Tax=Metarhizium acridum (strain CQMa 102) TaxID=655827 RepID=E9E378_METAQ|nr:C2H2 type zinc finger domain protein [Metarhizium acridum CQMa 102]EFY89673.1 C2H2 type zinc finger domain protein [Metarhizium acridum CQMa 102]